MEKNVMRVGSSRTKKCAISPTRHAPARENGYSLLSVLGILAICVCLIIPMHNGNRKAYSGGDAVAVMAFTDSSYYEKEKVTHPDVTTSADTDISIFEYIGNVIADLINRVQ